MDTPRMTIADLDEKQLGRIRDFEEELGAYVVALSPQYGLAELSPEQLKRLEAIEQELGVVLLAYENN